MCMLLTWHYTKATRKPCFRGAKFPAKVPQNSSVLTAGPWVSAPRATRRAGWRSPAPSRWPPVRSCCPLLLEQGYDVGFRVRAELGVQVTNMGLHRVLGKEQLLLDFGAAFSLGDEPHDLGFPGREAVSFR